MSRPETHFATSLFGAHPDQLWVITCYFNPCNYQSRWENYETFARRLLFRWGLRGRFTGIRLVGRLLRF